MVSLLDARPFVGRNRGQSPGNDAAGPDATSDSGAMRSRPQQPVWGGAGSGTPSGRYCSIVGYARVTNGAVTRRWPRRASRGAAACNDCRACELCTGRNERETPLEQQRKLEADATWG